MQIWVYFILPKSGGEGICAPYAERKNKEGKNKGGEIRRRGDRGERRGGKRGGAAEQAEKSTSFLFQKILRGSVAGKKPDRASLDL